MTAAEVRAIRGSLLMQRPQFAAAFGVPVPTMRDWEQGRRRPDAAACAYLLAIDGDAEAVRLARDAGQAAAAARLEPPPPEPEPVVVVRRVRGRMKVTVVEPGEVTHSPAPKPVPRAIPSDRAVQRTKPPAPSGLRIRIPVATPKPPVLSPDEALRLLARLELDRRAAARAAPIPGDDE